MAEEGLHIDIAHVHSRRYGKSLSTRIRQVGLSMRLCVCVRMSACQMVERINGPLYLGWTM